MRTVDVAIIGGSLAGAACVRTLTAAGIDAVAFEREKFPRERVCGGFLSPGAVDALEQIGVLRGVQQVGAVAVHSARLLALGGESHVAFRRPGLGISRHALDAVMGNHAAIEHGHVKSVRREPAGGFRLQVDSEAEVHARVVIDAAGKLSRFAALQTSPQFGVQFYGSDSNGSPMDFWFFPDGYGGTVTIEGGRSNSCFLIQREALPRYIGRPGCRVTGPVAYRARHSAFMAIGDAAGMIDPFCGEGMHHALDTGRIAAASVIVGLERHWTYAEIRRHYEIERRRRWARKRSFARAARLVLQHPQLFRAGLRLNLASWMDWFWNNV